MIIPFENLKTTEHSFTLGVTLCVFGKDAKNYLNSQVTSKMIELKDREFQHSAILDLSGKIVSSFILCREHENSFKLIVTQTEIENLKIRLEKFHISEDLEIAQESTSAVLYYNSKMKKGYIGKYFSKNETIEFVDQAPISCNENIFEQLCILTGIPRWGIEVNAGELINNTRLDELAVSYSKGCYPGQETVAKIDSRRGAAFKPVLLIVEHRQELEIGKITFAEKKIGELRSFVHIEGRTFAYAILNRETRIDKTQLTAKVGEIEFKSTVNYFPYLKLAPKNIAQDYYDAAIEVFKNDNNQRAINYFKKAIQMYPEFEDAYESLGVVYGREQNFQMAIETMEKLRALNPKCLMAYTNLSLYHMKVGNIETAEKFKSDATLLNFQVLGDEAKRKRELAEIDKRKELERDRREQMFKQVLELDEQDPMANNGMGEIELERNQAQKAQIYFEAAISGDKKYSVAYLGLAKAFIKLGNEQRLREVLNQGIKIASSNGDLMPANEMQSLLLKI